MALPFVNLTYFDTLCWAFIAVALLGIAPDLRQARGPVLRPC